MASISFGAKAARQVVVEVTVLVPALKPEAEVLLSG
jgi:hypothetical protein